MFALSLYIGHLLLMVVIAARPRSMPHVPQYDIIELIEGIKKSEQIDAYTRLMLSGDETKSNYTARNFEPTRFIVDELRWPIRNDASVCWWFIRTWPWKPPFDKALNRSFYRLNCVMYSGNNGFIEPILDGEEKLYMEKKTKNSGNSGNSVVPDEQWCLDLYTSYGFIATSWRDTIISEVFQFLTKNIDAEQAMNRDGVLCDAFALAGILGREYETDDGAGQQTIEDPYLVPHMDQPKNICSWTKTSSFRILGASVLLSKDVQRRVRRYANCDQDIYNDLHRDNYESEPGEHDHKHHVSLCMSIFTNKLYPNPQQQHQVSDFHHLPMEQIVAHLSRSTASDITDWMPRCDAYVVSAIILSNARTDTTVITDQDFLVFNPMSSCAGWWKPGLCSSESLGRGVPGYLPGTTNVNIFIKNYLVLAQLTNRTLVLPPSQFQDHYYLLFGRTRYFWTYDSEKFSNLVSTISWTGFVAHMMHLKAQYDSENRIRVLVPPHLVGPGIIQTSLYWPKYVNGALLLSKQFQLKQEHMHVLGYPHNGFDLSPYQGGCSRVGVPKVLCFNGYDPFWTKSILLNPDDTDAMGQQLLRYFDVVPQVPATVSRAVSFLLKLPQDQNQDQDHLGGGMFKAIQIRLDDLEGANPNATQISHVLATMRQHNFVKTDIIYAALVTSNRTYIAMLKEAYPLMYTLEDMKDVLGADCTVNMRGQMCVILEQHICARATMFIGSGFSSFGNHIATLREVDQRLSFWFDGDINVGQAPDLFLRLQYSRKHEHHNTIMRGLQRVVH